ncbi:hypothetical protein WR25_23600 [Diploscapter pachys]|uniref:O-methyltransferase domain-containing protein n=1 Tax=Diploscapter pachys TaxID=2018661 RepID=A0A2A2L2R9_9BILA|nr:hypothetical protein WR25_23600 [Diploscapter pachys]
MYPVWPTTKRRPETRKSLPLPETTQAPLELTAATLPQIITPEPTTPITPMIRTFEPPSSTEPTIIVRPTATPTLPSTPVVLPERMIQTSSHRPLLSTTKDNIPSIIKARRLTRIYPVTTTATPNGQCEICKPGRRCSVRLRSFETSDAVFQYAYSHSTMIDDSMQSLLKDTQTATYASPLVWHNSVSPEILQLSQTIMSLYHPSRCLVIGVFTGLGLLGIAEHVDSRGIVVALEHPEYSIYWEKIGLKHAKKKQNSQISRIQVRSTEAIEKTLPRLAANEPNTFDFIFLDDFKRENYLDDYEHSVRLLRSGGLLIINQAFNGGGVLSGSEYMSPEDRAVRNMNIRIKQDGRVRASLLPFSGGTWLISKK